MVDSDPTIKLDELIRSRPINQVAAYAMLQAHINVEDSLRERRMGISEVITYAYGETSAPVQDITIEQYATGFVKKYAGFLQCDGQNVPLESLREWEVMGKIIFPPLFPILQDELRRGICDFLLSCNLDSKFLGLPGNSMYVGRERTDLLIHQSYVVLGG